MLYFQEEKGKDPVCFCGYLKKDHTKEAKENIPTENEGWKNSSHTVVIPTNAYGDIEVTGHGQKMAKVFAQVSEIDRLIDR